MLSEPRPLGSGVGKRWNSHSLIDPNDAADRGDWIDLRSDRGGCQPSAWSRRGWTLPVAALVGCAVLAVSIYLMYRFAEPIGRILGKTAMNIIVRMSSLILLCIGVQIAWNGARTLLETILVTR
jgi:hypothetical protein